MLRFLISKQTKTVAIVSTLGKIKASIDSRLVGMADEVTQNPLVVHRAGSSPAAEILKALENIGFFLYFRGFWVFSSKISISLSYPVSSPAFSSSSDRQSACLGSQASPAITAVPCLLLQFLPGHHISAALAGAHFKIHLIFIHKNTPFHSGTRDVHFLKSICIVFLRSAALTLIRLIKLLPAAAPYHPTSSESPQLYLS